MQLKAIVSVMCPVVQASCVLAVGSRMGKCCVQIADQIANTQHWLTEWHHQLTFNFGRLPTVPFIQLAAANGSLLGQYVAQNSFVLLPTDSTCQAGL